jgi:hypothetical protein
MARLLRALGFAWAAPLTLVGFLYVTLFTLLGWYRRAGIRGDAMVWTVNVDRCPTWFYRRMHACGHTFGNVVVMLSAPTTDRGKIMVRHVQEHVHQCMVLGVFQPLLYSLVWVGLLFSRHAHPYYDNPFEIDARRGANQVVDIIGALQRLHATGKLGQLGSRKGEK